MPGRYELTCKLCGKKYRRDPYNPSKYCSRECRYTPGQIREDLVGKQFGPIKVLAFVRYKPINSTRRGGHPRQTTVWTVQCTNCGRISDMDRGNLKTRNSCRCLLRPAGYTGFFILYKRYKVEAERRGLAFLLSEDTFQDLTVSKCHYCGRTPSNQASSMPLEVSTMEHGIYLYNGIDRMDNTVGYTPSNCVPCCTMCNLSKRDIDYDKFCLYIKSLVENAAQGLVPCLNSAANDSNSGSSPLLGEE